MNPPPGPVSSAPRGWPTRPHHFRRQALDLARRPGPVGFVAGRIGHPCRHAAAGHLFWARAATRRLPTAVSLSCLTLHSQRLAEARRGEGNGIPGESDRAAVPERRRDLGGPGVLRLAAPEDPD